MPIFGRISVLKLFRPQGCDKDLLFLLTERYKFCVLEYDEATGKGGKGPISPASVTADFLGE